MKQNDCEFDWNAMYSGDAGDYEPPDPLVAELIGALEPGRALDVGCGAGGLLATLAQRGWRVTGVDIATKGVASARKVLDARGLEAELHVADSAAWTPPGQYDLITSTFALPGTKAERAKAFETMRGALAPGGTLVIKDFDPTMKKPPMFEAWDLVTVEELVKAFDGLQIVRAELVETPIHEHAREHTHEGEIWTAALLHARENRRQLNARANVRADGAQATRSKDSHAVTRRGNSHKRCGECAMHLSLCICGETPLLSVRAKLRLVIHRRETIRTTTQENWRRAASRTARCWFTDCASHRSRLRTTERPRARAISERNSRAAVAASRR